MSIDFSPSEKTLVKIRRIAKLREQGVIWTEVAKQIGHRPRYCRALHEYYVKIISKGGSQ